MAQDFLYENFCRPIVDSSVQGYNLVNTSVYAAILILAIVFVVYPFLKRNNVRVNFGFAVALLPFIFFGAAFRVLNDVGIFQKTCNVFDPGFFTFTPGIWILVAAIALVALAIAKRFSKSEQEFHKLFAAIGIIILAPVLLYEFTIFRAWEGFAFAVIGAMLITLASKAIVQWRWKNFFSDKLNILVVAGQALDGTATFVATGIYDCGEQHPLSGAILGVHPLLFVLVKVVLALLIVYYVDRDIKDENYAAFIKLAAMILGFAPGARDVLTIGAGTCL